MKATPSFLLALPLFLILSSLAAAQSSRPSRPRSTPEYTFEVVNRFPHDANAFTQGFAYHGGYFYEGTGRNGKSSLRQIKPETGEIVRKVDLAPEFFGEGITILGSEIFQLTWQSHTGFVYDLNSFQKLRSFQYDGEGWGLATDGHHLFLSDGSSEIRVLDPATASVRRRIKVRDEKTAVEQLNELEFVEGELYANVWHSDRIARISPRTGEVMGWINISGLPGPFYHLEAEAVLNGIAYDPEHKRLFVTGKLWPAIFEIRVVPVGSKKP
ncbi:MAG TPA: glutaminyl-peptide cyclotransferase [Candidatus Sulfotelmatobacter sp.]|jgi:glutamine cyclotransferase|nr:glutaminyl-peptide cyclotransferase [Candidatus Sulfotelmatobacter sp.]